MSLGNTTQNGVISISKETNALLGEEMSMGSNVPYTSYSGALVTYSRGSARRRKSGFNKRRLRSNSRNPKDFRKDKPCHYCGKTIS